MDRMIYCQNIGLKTKKIQHIVLIITMLCGSSSIFAETQQAKAVWYRYYDKNGVANISSSVTPAHIKNGYEALDRNMQVIKKNQAYNVEKDLQQSGSRAAELRRIEQDNRLKRAYGNSSVAINKKNELLQNMSKQLAVQNQNLKQLQNDRITLKRQEMEYYRKGSPVPTILKEHIKNNAENIARTKDLIESMNINYQSIHTQYDDIIQRLKKLE